MVSPLDKKEKKFLEKKRQRAKSSDTRLPENGGKPEFDPVKLDYTAQGKGDKNRIAGWYNDPEIAKRMDIIFGKKKTKQKDSSKKTR